MSIPVALDDLRDAIGRREDLAFLLTVGPDGRPHCVAVQVSWIDDDLAVAAGNRSCDNARERPLVSLLWPSAVPSEFTLIVDATATSTITNRVGGNQIVISPTKAVLHRPSWALS
ncbi:MAG: pyridoxamine 5'-phosphate oxidase family protein [Acidimicrobiales bacterium]